MIRFVNSPSNNYLFYIYMYSQLLVAEKSYGTVYSVHYIPISPFFTRKEFSNCWLTPHFFTTTTRFIQVLAYIRVFRLICFFPERVYGTKYFQNLSSTCGAAAVYVANFRRKIKREKRRRRRRRRQRLRLRHEPPHAVATDNLPALSEPRQRGGRIDDRRFATRTPANGTGRIHGILLFISRDSLQPFEVVRIRSYYASTLHTVPTRIAGDEQKPSQPIGQ